MFVSCRSSAPLHSKQKNDKINKNLLTPSLKYAINITEISKIMSNKLKYLLWKQFTLQEKHKTMPKRL